MNDMRPLIEEGTSDAARELLSAARGYRPSSEARQRVAAAAVAAGAGPTAGGVGPGDALRGSLRFAGKALAVFAVAGAIGYGLVQYGGSKEIAAPPRPAVAVTSVAVAPPNASVSVEPPQASTSGVAPAVPSESPVPSGPSSTAAAPKPSVSGSGATTSSLAEEVATIDVARRDLESHDAAGALRALDEHDRRFPRGVLGPEAQVLRVEALVMRGDRASAVGLARPIVSRDPNGPHAARLRRLLPELSAPSAP